MNRKVFVASGAMVAALVMAGGVAVLTQGDDAGRPAPVSTPDSARRDTSLDELTDLVKKQADQQEDARRRAAQELADQMAKEAAENPPGGQ